MPQGALLCRADPAPLHTSKPAPRGRSMLSARLMSCTARLVSDGRFIGASAGMPYFCLSTHDEWKTGFHSPLVQCQDSGAFTKSKNGSQKSILSLCPLLPCTLPLRLSDSGTDRTPFPPMPPPPPFLGLRRVSLGWAA